jgi:hypothetical protein
MPETVHKKLKTIKTNEHQQRCFSEKDKVIHKRLLANREKHIIYSIQATVKSGTLVIQMKEGGITRLFLTGKGR